jgi:ADP-L-glycero-D-manno-heptose 6-epimerase
MILITGGAGFIGSFLQAELAASGHETAICDWLGSESKWRNLARHPPGQLIEPPRLQAFLASGPKIEAIFHLGAISETTATDGDLVWRTNVELSQRLWRWCAHANVRLIYASSAATYGDGAEGFDDDPSRLERLKPLNLYGWSKHAFDLWVRAAIQRGQARPPQWAALKFFNVYGPNEYHKGKMVSVVKVKHDEVMAGRKPSLFRSDQPGLADGQQARDFIWVGDAVDVLIWLLENPSVNGLFNLGTGQARSYLDLAHAVCDASEVERGVDFIDMPESLSGQYQSFTQANMQRLREAGYARQFMPLEAGVQLYVQRYLRAKNPHH